MKKYSILLLSLLSVAACTKENTQDVAPVFNPDSKLIVHAAFDEESTRITTEDGLGFALEANSEQIGVYVRNGEFDYPNILFTAGDADEKGWISFSSNEEGYKIYETSQIFAYAPYSATSISINGSADGGATEQAVINGKWDGKRTINLPDVQTQSKENDFSHLTKYYTVVATPATPQQSDTRGLDSYSVDLQFSGVFALVRFVLQNEQATDVTVSKLVFSADAALTGYFNIDLTHENPKLSNTEYAPEAVEGKTFGKVEIQLATPAVIAAGKQTELFAVVNAVSAGTSKIEVYGTLDGKEVVFEKVISSAKTFARNKRVALGVKLENPVVADYAQEVIDALKNGGTVKIEKDVDLSSKAVTAPNGALMIEIPEGTEVNLNIPAGVTVKLANEGENIRLFNYGNVTISGEGSIEGAYGIMRNYGTLTVESGNFKTTNTTGGTALCNENGGTMIINDANVNAAYYALYNDNGTMTINGGTFKSTSNKSNGNGQDPAYCVCICGENAETTINYAVIEGIQGGLAAIDNATLTIHDGIFSTYYPENGETYLNHYALYTANVGTATVNGGKFYSEGSKVCIYTGDNDVEGQENGVIYLKGGYFEDMGHNQFSGETIKPAKGYKWVELAEPLVVTNESNGKTNTYYYQIVEGEDLGYKEVEGGYEIYSAKGLQWLAEQVNGGNNFSGKTVTLTADIDLENADWTPIGTKGNPFAGKFDGGSRTISNLNVNSPEEAFKGLFGRLEKSGTISNVNIDNATVKGLSQVGAIVGNAYTGSVSNCHVSGDIAIEGNYQVGGIAGNGYATISDCSVIGNAGSYVKGTYKENNLEGDAVGGIIGYACEEHTENDVISGCSATIDVSGTRKVGGIAGQCGHTANLGSCTFSGNVATNADEAYIAGNAGKIMVGGLVGELTNDGGTPPLCALYIRNCTVAEGSTVTGVDAKTTGAILGGSRTAGYTLNEENNTATGVTVTPSNELPEGIVKTETGYEIQSATGLSNLAALVNEGKDFAGETIVLADNMNLEDIAWTPIGNCSRSQTTGAAFRGTFDGNGKVISNLNCTLDADNFGAGLFGLLDGATVRNVTIDSGEISNNVDCAGAICGVMVGESIIENCHNTGATISAEGAAGGIVGRAYSKSNDTIKGCTNSAQVSGAQKVGGIVAIASNGGTHNIENCQNSGSVSGGNAGVGGIVGHTGGNQPTTVKNCTNTGTIGIATDLYAAGIVGFSIAASCNIENSNNEGTVTAINAGGIFGIVGSTQATNISGCENHGDVTGVNIAGGISAGTSSGTLENCKNTANITASAEGGIAGGIAGQYRNAAIVNCAGGAASAAVTAQYAGRIIGLALNGTVFANNMPEDARLTLDDSNGDDYSGISSIGAMGMYTSGGSIIIAGGTLHGLPVQAVELSHIRIEEGAAWDVYPNETGIWTSDKTRPWGREGLIETTDGYDIANNYGILHFAQMVNNGVSTFSGKTILLKNNLNLGGEEWMPIGIGTRDGSTYTGNAFKGTFDGNGKTISGLKISERSNSAGLIGVLDGGTVKNVTLEVDIDVASKANELAAGCVGLLTNNGLIENVTVNGSVKSEKAAAGIVSRVLKSGTVRNCHNHATVSGTSYNIGGIVGAAYYDNEGMTIEGCTNDGAVSGTYAVGGIAGLSAAEVKNCSNSAAITGNGTSVGGVIGEQQNAGSITGCTNTGNVTNKTAAYGNGGIVGWIRYTGDTAAYPNKSIITVSGCENRGSVSGGNDAGGIVGTVYSYGNIINNKNYAPTLSAKSFVAGVVGNAQFTEGHPGMTDEEHVYVTDNYSETTLDNMTGGMKAKFVYINNSDKTTSSGNTPDNN